MVAAEGQAGLGSPQPTRAPVVELVDALDSKSSSERSARSTRARGTIIHTAQISPFLLLPLPVNRGTPGRNWPQATVRFRPAKGVKGTLVMPAVFFDPFRSRGSERQGSCCLGFREGDHRIHLLDAGQT